MRTILALTLLLVAASHAMGATADELMKKARAYASAGKLDDALAAYEQIITQSPDGFRLWHDAQAGIADTLAKGKRFEDAARASYLAMLLAPNSAIFDRDAQAVARFLSTQDQNTDRANSFLSFQTSGAGDGRTNDFITALPASPERHAAFEKIRATAGDSAQASRVRGLTYLLEGDARSALSEFADGFRRSSMPKDAGDAAQDLILGQRAAVGHRLDQDKVSLFLAHGPEGFDGKPKTGDDLADPFAAFALEIPPHGNGGLARLSPEDVEALKKVRDGAMGFAFDPWMKPDIRRSNAGAVRRAKDALDDWAPDENVDRYLAFAFESADRSLCSEGLTCAAIAARSRELHMGSLLSVWSKADALAKNADPTLKKVLEDFRAQYDRTTDPLTKPQPPPNFKPLDKPAP